MVLLSSSLFDGRVLPPHCQLPALPLGAFLPPFALVLWHHIVFLYLQDTTLAWQKPSNIDGPNFQRPMVIPLGSRLGFTGNRDVNPDKHAAAVRVRWTNPSPNSPSILSDLSWEAARVTQTFAESFQDEDFPSPLWEPVENVTDQVQSDFRGTSPPGATHIAAAESEGDLVQFVVAIRSPPMPQGACLVAAAGGGGGTGGAGGVGDPGGSGGGDTTSGSSSDGLGQAAGGTSLSSGAIAGLGVGGVAALVGSIVLVLWAIAARGRRRQAREMGASREPEVVDESPKGDGGGRGDGGGGGGGGNGGRQDAEAGYGSPAGVPSSVYGSSGVGGGVGGDGGGGGGDGWKGPPSHHPGWTAGPHQTIASTVTPEASPHLSAAGVSPSWMRAEAVEQRSLEVDVAAAAQELYQAPSPWSAGAGGTPVEGGPVTADRHSVLRTSPTFPTSTIVGSTAGGSSVPGGEVISSVSDVTSSLFESTPSAGGASAGVASAGGVSVGGASAGSTSVGGISAGAALGAAAAAGGGVRDARAEFPAPPSIPAVLLSPRSSVAESFDAPYAAGGQGGASPW